MTSQAYTPGPKPRWINQLKCQLKGHCWTIKVDWHAIKARTDPTLAVSAQCECCQQAYMRGTHPPTDAKLVDTVVGILQQLHNLPRDPDNSEMFNLDVLKQS